MPVLVAAAVAGGAAEPQDMRVLLRSYFRFVVAQQIPAQADGLAAEASDAQRKQVVAALSGWRGQVTESLRHDLQQAFGDEARGRFEQFVGDYTLAEKNGDMAYLKRTAGLAGFTATPPATYAELHRRVTTEWLQADLDAGAALLGEVQTWLEVSGRTPDAPALSAWLTRPTQTWAPVARPVMAVPSRRQSLRDAEGTSGEFVPPAEAGAGALDTFDQARRERRQRALEESQAAMQQVASEREAAEREVAGRKAAAAQTEAEAVKRYADKLAATETEALEQRKDSWGNKLKGIVSATVGAATGALTSGIGTEAGRRLTDAIFDRH